MSPRHSVILEPASQALLGIGGDDGISGSGGVPVRLHITPVKQQPLLMRGRLPGVARWRAHKQQPGERETGGPHAIAAAELMGRLESLCISELNAGDLPSESSGAY